MRTKGVPVRDWVPFGEGHLFDQTNGRVGFDGPVDDAAASNLRRLIDAGIIVTLATATTMGGW